MSSFKRFLLIIIIAIFIIFVVTYLTLSIIIINQSDDHIDAIIREQIKIKNKDLNKDEKQFQIINSNQNFLKITNSLNFYDNNKTFLNNDNFDDQINNENFETTSKQETVDDDEQQQHLLDYIKSPQTLKPFNFDKCQMLNCFDFSRCLNNDDNTLKVYIVPSSLTNQQQPSIETEILTQSKKDIINSNKSSSTIAGESNIIHRNILKIIKGSKYYESDPEKACLFLLEDDTLDRDPLSPSYNQNLPTTLITSENFYGMNHLIFNLYSGTWPDYKENDFAGLQFGAAIIAKASNSLHYHRRNFDISLPLFSYQHPYDDDDDDIDDNVNDHQKDVIFSNDGKKDSERDINSSNYNNNVSIINQEQLITNNDNMKNRKSFFLTFKGKRYVIGSGSKTRNSLYHLNNNRDVIMLTTCRHGKKWRESSDLRCFEDESNYDKYDFVDLMKESTFCLVPRGRRLGSFRFLEALKYGCIPVIMSDGWVNPFDEIIDWSEAIVRFDEDLLLIVPDMLRDIDRETIRRMQQKCSYLYDKHFSTTTKIILSVLTIIEKRILQNKKLANH